MRLLKYEEKTKDFCFQYSCFEQKNVYDLKNPDSFEDIVKEEFIDFLKDKRRKNVYISCLSFVLVQICQMVFDEERKEIKDSSLVFNLFEYDEDLLKSSGCVFYVSKNNTKKQTYKFNEGTFSHSTLIKCLNFLEEKHWLIHTNGWTIVNENVNNVQKGFEFVYYPDFYLDFYGKYYDKISEILSSRKIISSNDKKEYVEVRESKEEFIEDKNGKYLSVIKKRVLNLKTEGLNGLSVIKKSRKVLKELDKMYEEMNVTLSSFDEVSEGRKQEVINTWNSRRNEPFDRSLLEKIICRVRNYMSRYTNYPKRIFYRDTSTDELVFGRIYHNKSGVDNLFSFLVPLLKIDGEEVVDIDIKSCCLQMFIMEHVPGVDNKQDFYHFDCLKDFNREDVKSLIQRLIYNDDKERARRSYNHLMKQKDFDFLIKSMLEEKPYFKKLFLNYKMSRSLVRVESDFMINLIENLMSNNYKFIYHFDSLIIKKSDLENIINFINDKSNLKWKRKLNLTVSFNVD